MCLPPIGAVDDCTHTGVAIDITQMGTNNTYLLPADDASATPRFDANGELFHYNIFFVFRTNLLA